jgi:hypothetical protein
MSIDRSESGAPVIVIGDEDVLTGVTPATGLVRFWFAPLPPSTGLTINIPEPRKNTEPPADTVATVYFVNPDALDGFIRMLTEARAKAFPKNISDS